MKMSLGPFKMETDVELLGNGTDSYLKLVPGRTLVSIARAKKKTEDIFTECVNDLMREAKRYGWSQELLMWRVQSAAENFGKRINLEEVVNRSVNLLDNGKEIDEQTVDSIDSEWMHALVDHAEDTSDEDMRDIVAAILAGEVNKPGSYSKSAISTLARMDADQVRTFEDVCGYIIQPGSFEADAIIPLEVRPALVLSRDDDGSSYMDELVPYSSIMELEVLGLVSKDSRQSYGIEARTRVPFIVGSEYALFENHGSKKEIWFPIALTKTGAELSRLFKRRHSDSLRKHLAKKAEEDGLIFSWIKPGDRLNHV